MSIEIIQSRAETIVHYFPLIAPVLLVAAIICAIYRRSHWIAPLWTAFACPVVGFLLLLVYMFLRTCGGHGPDWGFVGMGTMFILLLSLFEVVPGIALLLAYPRGQAWTPRTRIFSCITGLVSSGAFVFSLQYMPVHHL